MMEHGTADCRSRADKDHLALAPLHHPRQKCLEDTKGAKVVEVHGLFRYLNILFQEPPCTHRQALAESSLITANVLLKVLPYNIDNW